MENWIEMMPGGIDLTIESEAYLELAKEDLSKYEYADARKELEVAVRSANPQAEYLLGYLYNHGLGVDRNVEKALSWYLRAAENGYAPAQTAAAKLYLDGDDVPADYAEAYRLLILAAQQEYDVAEYLLGYMLLSGFQGEIDIEKAFFWMEKAAIQDYEQAVFTLAQNSAFGIAVNETWARKAAEYGECYPLINVAQRYIDGNAAPQNIEKGVLLLSELADKENGSAQMALAERLTTGKGIPKDVDKAFEYLAKAAQTGNASLITQLGVALYKGDEQKIAPDTAVKFWELAASAGSVDALVELGNLYLDGAGDLPPDEEKAFGYFLQAAEADNSRGWEWTGYCLYEGKGIPKNRQEAARWYKKAAKKGLYNSCYMLGMIYGYDDALFDYEQAVFFFEKSAELGQPVALVKLGTMHLNGTRATPPNREEAFEYFLRAAQADDELGWKWLTHCHYRGYGSRQNQKKALQFYRETAKAGKRDGRYMLGMLYGYDATSPDYRKAARWFKEAAKQGHSDAQLKLGFYYHHGRGVVKNYKKAFVLFIRAAEAVHSTAMNNIGDAYEHGYGVKQDLQKAYEWYLGAAKNGDKNSMYSVGVALYGGIGTEQDTESGKKWIQKAAEAGLQEAKEWQP